MTNKRNYNEELKDRPEHKYAYNFDFDVMHKYMVRSFVPFFREGSMLELGSFKGDFTKRLLPYFDDITCVEASDEAIAIARKDLGDNLTYINALFEEVTLPRKYDNIILTHVLEHLDEPFTNSFLRIKHHNVKYRQPGHKCMIKLLVNNGVGFQKLQFDTCRAEFIL